MKSSAVQASIYLYVSRITVPLTIKMEADKELRENRNPSETEGMTTVRDNIEGVTTADSFAQPIVILKDSDKEFLKNLIADAISERLRQVEGLKLANTNLSSHSSILFLLSY